MPITLMEMYCQQKQKLKGWQSQLRLLGFLEQCSHIFFRGIKTIISNFSLPMLHANCPSFMNFFLTDVVKTGSEFESYANHQCR